MTAQAVPDNTAASTDGPSVLAAIVQTDSTGQYRLETVPVGRYYIAAGLVDFPTYYPGVVAIGQAKAVEVTTSAALTGIDFSLVRPQGLRITGRIVREEPSAALPRGGFGNAATERVVLQGSLRQVVTPSADGSFEFTNLGPGKYTVSLQPLSGLQPQAVNLRDVDETVEIRVPRLASLTGRLLQDVDGARPRVGLVLVDEASRNRITLTPSSAGTYQAVIPLGTYRVETLQALPTGFTMKSMVGGGVDLLSNPLKVAAGDTPQILVTLAVSSPPPWTTVSGRIVGFRPAPTGPVQKPRVQMTGPAAGEILEANVNADGTFEFPRVLTGQYIARYINPAVASSADDQITVDVASPGLANLEIKAAALVEVRGQVEVQGNPRFLTTGPPVRVSFTASDPRGRSLSTTSPVARDGAFTLTVAEDSERLVLTNVPAGLKLKSLTYGSANVLTDAVKFVPGDGKELRVVLEAQTTGAVKVSGKVTGLNPMRSVSVALVGTRTLMNLGAVTNPDDGSFEFPQVFPGIYTVKILANPPGVTVTATITVDTVNIAGLELRIPPSRQVSGSAILEGSGTFQPRFALAIAGNAGTTTVTPMWQSDGSFRVMLPEGESKIDISALPPGLTVKTLSYGETDLLRAPALVSAANNPQLRMTLTSTGARLVHLTGRYIAPSPAPAQRAPAGEIIRLNGPMAVEIPLRDDGTFEFPRVLSGTYQWCCPYGSMSLAIPDRETASITIRSIRGGILFDDAPNTYQGLGLVRAVHEPGGSSGSIQPDGTFILTLLDGAEYSLSIPSLPAGFYIKSIRYGTADITNRSLSVAPGEDAPELRITVGRRP